MTAPLDAEIFDKVRTYDEFVDLALEIGLLDKAQVFDFLFPLAISARGHASGTAAQLLIEIEPPATRTCVELFDEVARSYWDVSMREIPFYFISQFGKHGLISAYEDFIKTTTLTDIQKQRVGTIIYWTAGSTANLIRAYHDWPWREADESANCG